MTARTTSPSPDTGLVGEAGAALKADIESRINLGEWPAGHRLPGERALAAQYGVSRAVVREVLQSLSVQGSIQISPARGAFVQRPDGTALSGALSRMLRTHGATVRDVVEARVLLETEITSRAAANRGGGLTGRLAELAETLDSGENLLTQAIADLKFHSLLCLAAGNPVLTAMHRAIAPYVLFMTLRRERGHEHSGARHGRLVDVVRSGDVDAARELSGAHLSATEFSFGADFDRPVEEVAAQNLERISAGLWTLEDVERRAFAELDALVADTEKERWTVSEPVRVAILGAGGRGAETYGQWFVEHPERGRAVAVAEALDHRRDLFADRAAIPPENRFSSWPELMADSDRLGLDAVVVALPDHDHIEPTVAAAERGLAVLLEKPIAPDPDTLRSLEERLSGLEPRIAVAHVLRETPFWRAVQRVVSSGVIGDPVTIRVEENIGFWHFAHSYVRGNWRRADTSSPMVLAKTSHDLDIIRWLAGSAPERVSSTGGLTHFHSGNAPEGAPTHCAKGCPAAETCPFHAPRYYAEAMAGVDGWPVALSGPDTSPQGRMAALADGPYGRCVYHSDNDVVDHQQTVFSFPGGMTASLTTSAFTGANTRTFQITGTRGEVSGRMDPGDLRLETFAPGPHDLPDLGGQVHSSVNGPLGHSVHEWRARPPRSGSDDHRGHAGGDAALTSKFVDAVASDDFGAHVTTTLAASLDSHWMAFAAERSRLTRRTLAWSGVRT